MLHFTTARPEGGRSAGPGTPAHGGMPGGGAPGKGGVVATVVAAVLLPWAAVLLAAQPQPQGPGAGGLPGAAAGEAAPAAGAAWLQSWWAGGPAAQVRTRGAMRWRRDGFAAPGKRAARGCRLTPGGGQQRRWWANVNGGPGGGAASWVDVTVPITARLPEFHKAGGLGPGHRELSLGSIAKVRDEPFPPSARPD